MRQRVFSLWGIQTVLHMHLEISTVFTFILGGQFLPAESLIGDATSKQGQQFIVYKVLYNLWLAVMDNAIYWLRTSHKFDVGSHFRFCPLSESFLGKNIIEQPWKLSLGTSGNRTSSRSLSWWVHCIVWLMSFDFSYFGFVVIRLQCDIKRN